MAEPRRSARGESLRAGLFLVLALAAIQCASQTGSTPSAAPTQMESSKAQVTQLERGEALFLANCARCHGQQGEGDIGPPLMGPTHGLRGYGTARGLFDYVSQTMPFDAAGSLPEQDYWDILAFILTGNEVLPEGTILGPDTADDVQLDP